MDRIQWERDVPIFKNRFILKGVGLAIGIPFAAVFTVVTVLSKGDILGTDAKYIFGMIGIFSLLVILLVFALYCGRYVPGFIVDEEGIVNYSQQKRAKNNRFYNMILIVFGLFRRAYAPIGGGFSALSKPVAKMEWKNIRKVRCFPKQCAILVKGGFTEKIAIFCTKGNYEAVVQAIKEKMEQYSKI